MNIASAFMNGMHVKLSVDEHVLFWASKHDVTLKLPFKWACETSEAIPFQRDHCAELYHLYENAEQFANARCLNVKNKSKLQWESPRLEKMGIPSSLGSVERPFIRSGPTLWGLIGVLSTGL